MFGFLSSAKHDAEYRQAYARCCRYLRLHFGAASAPLVSYEAVFAFQMMREGAGLPALPSSDPTCCRLRGARGLVGAEDERFGRLANAFGVLLASIKLKDDVRDDHSLAARLGLLWFRKAIKHSRRCFAEIDPAAPARLDAIVAEHVAMEKTSRGGTLDEFMAPTAEGFAYAFELLAKADPRLTGYAVQFREIGHSLGAAIIAADCAADWRRDLRRGLPNPIRDRAAADAAINQAQRLLAVAGWTWNQALPIADIALRILRATIERLDRLRNDGFVKPPAPSLRRKAWRYARAGDCDCDCGGCDCPAGDGGDGCCDGCGSCCDPCTCFCDPVCGNNRSQKNKTSKKAIRGGGDFVGKRGRANGDLGPAGIVVINGRSLAAKTQGKRIPGGAEVVVVEDGEFGIVVEPANRPA